MEVISISCGLWMDVCRHSCSLGSDCPGQREHLATLRHRLSSGRMSFKMVACGLVPRNLRVAGHARLSHLASISAVSRVVRRAIGYALQMLKRCFKWDVSMRELAQEGGIPYTEHRGWRARSCYAAKISEEYGASVTSNGCCHSARLVRGIQNVTAIPTRHTRFCLYIAMLVDLFGSHPWPFPLDSRLGVAILSSLCTS